jgi:3-methyladenine DNA glycosylase AlkD
MRRHDRIDNWDLVDRCAPSVVGGYLQDELDDTFAIAEILVHDDADLVRKAVGGWIREAGKRDPARLLRFLDRYAGTMPRTMLRYALEHQSP